MGLEIDKNVVVTTIHSGIEGNNLLYKSSLVLPVSSYNEMLLIRLSNGDTIVMINNGEISDALIQTLDGSPESLLGNNNIHIERESVMKTYSSQKQLTGYNITFTTSNLGYWKIYVNAPYGYGTSGYMYLDILNTNQYNNHFKHYNHIFKNNVKILSMNRFTYKIKYIILSKLFKLFGIKYL
jgi:hypothetical protein